jgi:tight adherence protein C
VNGADLGPTLAATAAVCVAAGLGSARRAAPPPSLVSPVRDGHDDRPGRHAAPSRRFFTRRAVRRHRARVDAEIPQLLDLLAAGSSAGLSAPLALRRAVDGLAGPLADEILTVVRAVDVGARWRDELEALVARLDLPDLRRTVAALTRTETLGSSLAQATAELAASVRRARRAATSERARIAPVKMLFPLVFLVLPAFLLLTVVPVLLTTVQSIN